MNEEPRRDAPRVIRLADPLPCVSCGENASAAYAEPEESGRWLITPYCVSCTDQLARLYEMPKEGAGLEKSER
jgi:hypothetical protein